ncbi:MAG: YhbY family RNA-binding protein [Myxococcaceae bacterium]
MALSGKQRRALRALGHHLNPVVLVGHAGVTDGVIAAVDQALVDHELVKVKLGDDRDARAEHLTSLSSATHAEVAQTLGRTALLFRAKPEKSNFGWLETPGVRPPKEAAKPSQTRPSQTKPKPAKTRRHRPNAKANTQAKGRK